MATRSMISLEIEKDVYKSIYCHSDGYLTHNGALLVDHYNSRDKIEELLKLGDISILAESMNPDPNLPHSFNHDERQKGVVVAYGRDRGETGTEAKDFTLKELLEDTWIDYFYIFTLDNKWKYYTYKNHEKARDVLDDIKSEYEYMGIMRPKGYYGFWTPNFIAEEKKRQSEYVQDVSDRKYIIEDKEYDPIRIGGKGDFDEGNHDNATCHDCARSMGQIHLLRCDAERCPNCGLQFISCDCDVIVVDNQGNKSKFDKSLYYKVLGKDYKLIADEPEM